LAILELTFKNISIFKYLVSRAMKLVISEVPLEYQCQLVILLLIMPPEPFSLAVHVFLNTKVAFILIRNEESAVCEAVFELTGASHDVRAPEVLIAFLENTEALSYAMLGLAIVVHVGIDSLVEVCGHAKCELNI
jgi:hypothetical protein